MALPEPARRAGGAPADGLPTLTEVLHFGGVPPSPPLAVVFDARRDAGGEPEPWAAPAPGGEPALPGGDPPAGVTLGPELDQALNEAVAQLMVELQPRLAGLLRAALLRALATPADASRAGDALKAAAASPEPPCIP